MKLVVDNTIGMWQTLESMTDFSTLDEQHVLWIEKEKQFLALVLRLIRILRILFPVFL